MVVTKIDNMASYSTYTGKPKILFPKKVRIKNLRSHRRHTFYNNMYAIGILIAAFKTRKNYINKVGGKAFIIINGLLLTVVYVGVLQR